MHKAGQRSNLQPCAGTGSQTQQQQCQQPNQQRRAFKDKFHSMLQEAQEAHIKAAHQQELQDRRSLAVAMLVHGRAQAFVNFFMLSQPASRPVVLTSASRAGAESQAAADEAGAASTSGGSEELPWQSLVLLQQQLVRADAASKAGDMQTAFDAYRHVAKHFTQLATLENAVFFWKKCLQVAVSSTWGAGELEASCALGLLYESLGQPQLAMSCHERCLQLAQELQRQDDASTAYAQLVQVYAQQAETHSRQGEADAAGSFYEKCMDAALKCGDMAAAGAAAHHLGLIAQHQGNWQQALEHQRAYVDISRQAGDQEAEGRACVAYAECQQQLGQLEGAVDSLETFLQLSRLQAPRGQATACCKLGVLYQQQGKMEQTVTYFERFYELARSLGERRLLDLARVNLGAARAAVKLKQYKAMAWGNLDGLLAWKQSRQAF